MLTPFVLVGGWARRRSVDFGPFFTYAVILFAASGLLFAVHVPYGTFLHSAVALVAVHIHPGPRGRRSGVAMGPSVPADLDRSGRCSALRGGVGRVRRPHRGAYIPMVIQGGMRHATIASRRERPWIDRRTRDRPADDCRSWRYEYFTGHGGVSRPPTRSTPSARSPATTTSAGRPGAGLIVQSMIPVIELTDRPAWIGAPIFDIPYKGDLTGDPAVDGAPAPGHLPGLHPRGRHAMLVAPYSRRAAP